MRLAVLCVSLSAVSIATQLSHVETRSSQSESNAAMMPLVTWTLTMVPLFASLTSYNVVFGELLQDTLNCRCHKGNEHQNLPQSVGVKS